LPSLKSLVFALIRSRIALPTLALVALIFTAWWAFAPEDREPNGSARTEANERSGTDVVGQGSSGASNAPIEAGSPEAQELVGSEPNAAPEAPEESNLEETYQPDRAVEARRVQIKPSFNCAIAGLPAERLICGSSELATLDLELTETYSGALGRAKMYDRKYGPPSSQVAYITLVQDQSSWLRNSRNRCQSDDCIFDVYQNRLDYLRRYQPS
jgi:hypothetical protein